MEIQTLTPNFPIHTHPYRSKGVHLSDILDFIEITALGKKPFHENADNQLWAEIGFLWETVMKERVLGMHGTCSDSYVDGELSMDGIVGSPDMMDIFNDTIWEFKCTWKSCKKHPVSENQRWLWQVKSYCHMAGYNKALICALYINGSYSPLRPIYEQTLFTFTDQELAGHWSMILTNAKSGGFLL